MCLCLPPKGRVGACVGCVCAALTRLPRISRPTPCPVWLPAQSTEAAPAALGSTRGRGARRKAPLPAQQAPPAPCPSPRPSTFGLAGVVCLHEVARAAAEMAALGVVAELGAGAEAQALVDVWGGKAGSWRDPVRLGFLSLGPVHPVPPSYPGIQAGLAPCGSRSGRHSRRLSRCARSGPHPRRCWRWWHSWSAWGLWETESGSSPLSRPAPARP